MKLSQIAPMRWYHQVNLWTMNLSPWRYAASGIASGSALGQRDAYRQRSGNEKATPSHRRDSQSASRHAAIREQRQRLREHLIQPGVL